MSCYFCDACGVSHDHGAREYVAIVTPTRQLESCDSGESELVRMALGDCPEGTESELVWDGQTVHYPARETDDAVWRELVEEAKKV